jgi:putative spermidine/putrescine transport system substrate-binding protein
MTTAGTLNQTFAAALPPVNGTPVFLSPSQATSAAAYLNSNWAQAIGS